MRRLFSNWKPILAGVAAATPLFLLMWIKIGVPYASGIRDDYSDQLLMIGMLFWGELMPPTLVMAFLAGLVTGCFNSELTESELLTRGMKTAIIFSIFIALPACVFSSETGSSLLASHANVFKLPYGLLILLADLLAFVFLSMFAVLGSIPFILISGSGAIVGNKLLRTGKSARYVVIAATVLLSVSFIEAQSSTIRSYKEKMDPQLKAAQSAINRELVDVPKSSMWRIKYRDMLRHREPAKMVVYFDIGEENIGVEIDESGQIKSAHLSLMAPEGYNLNSRKSAVSYLQKKHIRKQMLQALHQEKGMWIAEKGEFSVFLSAFHPPMD